MEEERIIEGVAQTTIEDDKPYDKLLQLNEAISELSNDLMVDNNIDSNDVVNNEISMPTVSETESQEDLVKEITTDEEEEVVESEESSKGQFILIGILTVILVALLIAMVVFTNAL